MDEFYENTCSNSNTNTTEVEEQKLIEVKHRKIKRATRTYLYHIDHWLTQEELTKVGKEVKKKLATSSQVINDEDGMALTFNGDHTQNIKSIIIQYASQHANGKITKNSFA